MVEAAAALIGERGFDGTSLEAVAARAGVSRGAIYGNFANKEALFLAVVAARWRPVMPPFAPDGDFAAHMQAAAEALIQAMPGRRAAALGAASFQIYALTHPAMRERVAAANADIYRQMADLLRPSFEGGDMTPELFVRVMHAVVDGLMFLHALTPDLIDEGVVRAAFLLMGKVGK